MPVTPQENESYQKFVTNIAQEIGVLDYKPDDIIWHYTNGEGLLGILQSSTLYATQVAALNDAKETEYATDLFKDAINQVISEKAGDENAIAFLNAVLDFVKEEPENPTRGISKFFVTCFCADSDDVTQWDRYGKGNGYAIGFFARGLHRTPWSTVYRVVYDRVKLERAAKQIAEATLNFYMKGLSTDPKRAQDSESWAREFFDAWDEWVYRLAPLAKSERWRAENEYRIVHELNISEFSKVRFGQKKTMLSRYIALDFPCWVKRRTALLPIAKIMIGPGNHPAFTAVSIKLLLEQMGYPDGIPIERTTCSLTYP